jgi:hypothetical protein
LGEWQLVREALEFIQYVYKVFMWKWNGISFRERKESHAYLEAEFAHFEPCFALLLPCLMSPPFICKWVLCHHTGSFYLSYKIQPIISIAAKYKA